MSNHSYPQSNNYNGIHIEHVSNSGQGDSQLRKSYSVQIHDDNASNNPDNTDIKEINNDIMHSKSQKLELESKPRLEDPNIKKNADKMNDLLSQLQTIQNKSGKSPAI